MSIVMKAVLIKTKFAILMLSSSIAARDNTYCRCKPLSMIDVAIIIIKVELSLDRTF